jgi:CxxC-x17-CxxC domain-containing protein
MGRFKSRDQMRADSLQRRYDREEYSRPRKSHLEMTEVICAKCGRNCEVPFKPTSDKPVYCRNCFKQEGPSDFGNKPSNFSSRERFNRSEPKSGQSSEELEKINRKLDKIMRALKID